MSKDWEQNFHPVFTPARMVGGNMLKLLNAAAALHEESGVRANVAEGQLAIARAELNRAQIEVADRDHKIAELAELANKDALTGLLNRRGLDVAFEHALTGYVQSAHRRRSEGLQLVMFDIDNFKSYNERYGHTVGDKVIQQVAGASRLSLRTDEGDILGRWGGDEFIAVLRTSDKVAVSAAERIRSSVEGLTDCTVSVGVVNVDDFEQFRDLNDFYQAGSAAMKQAKLASPLKNSVFVLDPIEYQA